MNKAEQFFEDYKIAVRTAEDARYTLDVWYDESEAIESSDEHIKFIFDDGSSINVKLDHFHPFMDDDLREHPYACCSAYQGLREFIRTF